MDISLPRGIRDIEPEEYQYHSRVRTAFEDVARIYNFKVMEPASIEHLGTLRMKSGEDVDNEIYAFKDKGGRDLGLRFDLTVGITRYVCSRKDLKLPAKIAAFGGMWRYDEPQYGRYRWAHQWDLEIFGPPSVESDAEVIDASSAIMRRVGLERTVIKVGDRRIVEGFIRGQVGVADESKVVELMRALDKVEKKSRTELAQEYETKGFSSDELDRVLDLGKLNGAPDDVLRRAAERKLTGIGDLERLSDLLKARGVRNVEFNLRIVRGIDYYTGIVFEIADASNPKLGSLCGGGRYDALPRAFGRPDLAATGAAGGVERESMSMAGSIQGQRPTAFVAYAAADVYGAASEVLSRVREAGVPCDISLPGKSLGKQLEDASAAGAKWAIIVGRKEVATNTLTLKDMETRKEESVPTEKAIELVSGS